MWPLSPWELIINYAPNGWHHLLLDLSLAQLPTKSIVPFTIIALVSVDSTCWSNLVTMLICGLDGFEFDHKFKASMMRGLICYWCIKSSQICLKHLKFLPWFRAYQLIKARFNEIIPHLGWVHDISLLSSLCEELKFWNRQSMKFHLTTVGDKLYYPLCVCDSAPQTFHKLFFTSFQFPHTHHPLQTLDKSDEKSKWPSLFSDQKGKRILARQGCCSWTMSFCI